MKDGGCPDSLVILCVPGACWVFRAKEGTENNGPWVPKPLTLHSNRHPYLLSDLPAGFCVRFKKSVLLLKKKKKKVFETSSLCTLGFHILHSLGAVLSHSS